ncbi:MAG TPA: hypothetical protein VNU68_35445 [Verrucomicrobiae bacterium]|nr:hypothetical protein [Verrucomicrobiae bacterium]
MRGNVSYTKMDIEADHLTDDGTRQAAWETKRGIEHPREHEEATKIRSKARSLITSVCSPSSFGLLCPASDGEKLTAAVEEARGLADAFNRTANVTRIAVYVIIGRVAADDVEAIRAINGEIRDLMTAMERGLRNLDVQAVRDAANKAKALSTMLSPDAAERAQRGIDAARSAARKIVKAGEQARRNSMSKRCARSSSRARASSTWTTPPRCARPP